MNKQLSQSVESSRLSRKVKDVGIAKELRPIPNEKLLSEWEIHEFRNRDDVGHWEQEYDMI